MPVSRVPWEDTFSFMNIQLFKPYERQKDFITKFASTDDLFGVVSAPRGSGKTLLCINLMLLWLLEKPNRKGGYITPVYGQGKSVMDQIVNTSEAVITTSNRMEGTITFMNGSTLKFLSSDNPDNIRGFRFTHLIIDECAFIKESSLNTAILPTLNPNGKKCLMVSTPKGKNHFYSWFIKEGVVSMSFPLTDCPFINPMLVDEARKSLPKDIFRQEFEAAFVDSANDVFTGVEKVSTVTNFDTVTRQEVYVGIDTGLSDDKSVLTVINTVGRVINVVSDNHNNIVTIADKFVSALSSFTVVGGYCETNGIGRAMYDLIQPKLPRIRPFNTNQDNKTEMVRKLIHDIETMSIELPSLQLLPELHQEFNTYTYKLSQTGKLSFTHMSGQHDDFIDSLMLANYSRNQFIRRNNFKVKPVEIKKPRSRFAGLTK